jgi:hypothetical protein
MRHSALSLSSNLLARIAVGVTSGENDCEMHRSAGCRPPLPTVLDHPGESGAGARRAACGSRLAETMTEIEVSDGKRRRTLAGQT